MNPYYAPYQGKPPLVERRAECRPKKLRYSAPSDRWFIEGFLGEFIISKEAALAMTRCAVLEACGKVLHETMPDGRVQLRDEFVVQRWVFHLGEAASLGNDITINELAHQLCDVKEQP